jgi:uncharacterized protein (DUF2147 family)
MARWILSLLAAASVFNLAPAHAGTATDPTGVWLTQAGDARIRISSCGNGICGQVIWLKVPIDPTTGFPPTDDKNADPALAHRPIIGLPIFNGMTPVANGKWSGRIYNADNGKTYSSSVTLAAPRVLEVRGCVLSILCGGETWTKVSSDLASR